MSLLALRNKRKKLRNRSKLIKNQLSPLRHLKKIKNNNNNSLYQKTKQKRKNIPWKAVFRKKMKRKLLKIMKRKMKSLLNPLKLRNSTLAVLKRSNSQMIKKMTHLRSRVPLHRTWEGVSVPSSSTPSLIKT